MATVAKKNDGFAPQLRFPEFRTSPGWERRTLSDLLAERKERNRELTYGPQDVLSVSGEYGCVNQIEHLGRSYAGASVKEYHVVETGDLVYTKSPLKKNPYGIIKENKGRPGIVSTLYAVYCPTNLGHSVFLDHYFSSGYHLNTYLQPLVKKGAKNDMKVNNAAVLSGSIFVPSKPEQEKIAKFLTSHDDVLLAERRKLEALREHKKALMQQLFPHEGEVRPQLRLPEFRRKQPWVSKQISSLLEKASVPVEVEPDATYREIGVRSHGKGIFHKEEVTGATIGAKRVFRVVEDALVLNIVFAWEQAVACTTNSDAGLIASHRFPMYLPKSNACDVRFIALALLTPGGKHLLGIASPGGAGRNRTLGQDAFEKIELMVPGRDEQSSIAEVILSADSLIAAQTQKLEILRAYKKGLAQRIFLSPEGNKR